MLPLRPSFQTENVVFYLERRSLFPLRHTKATDLSPAVLIPLLRRVYSLVSTLVTPAHAALQAAPKNCQGERPVDLGQKDASPEMVRAGTCARSVASVSRSGCRLPTMKR